MVLFADALSLFYCDKKQHEIFLLTNVYAHHTAVLAVRTLPCSGSLGLCHLAGLKL